MLLMAVVLIAVPLMEFGRPSIAAAASWQDGAGADPVAAVAQPAAQPDAANNEGGKTDATSRKSILVWLYNSLGVSYILVFMGLSFVLVGLIITNIISARRERVCPQTLVDGFEGMLDEKKYQDAYELAKADESFLGNVLSTGLARINSGYEKASEAMQEAGQEESMKIQHLLSYLALIGTISPMVGLFGTVHGMISAFFEIATAGGSPDPQKLADGISKALVTTLIGLAIAIPAIAAYNILRNRFERLELEVGIASDTLMSRFESVGTKT
jgi:biopolymer transport protein ExbB